MPIQDIRPTSLKSRVTLERHMRILHRSSQPSTAQSETSTVTAVITQPVQTPRPYAVPPLTKHRLRLPQWLQLILMVSGAVMTGMLVQSAIVSQLLVLTYGAIALIWRVPSNTTFTLALLSITATIILPIVKPNPPLAQNFATMAFLLLVVGVISLSIELKKGGRPIRSNKKYRY